MIDFRSCRIIRDELIGLPSGLGASDLLDIHVEGLGGEHQAHFEAFLAVILLRISGAVQELHKHGLKLNYVAFTGLKQFQHVILQVIPETLSNGLYFDSIARLRYYQSLDEKETDTGEHKVVKNVPFLLGPFLEKHFTVLCQRSPFQTEVIGEVQDDHPPLGVVGHVIHGVVGGNNELW